MVSGFIVKAAAAILLVAIASVLVFNYFVFTSSYTDSCAGNGCQYNVAGPGAINFTHSPFAFSPPSSISSTSTIGVFTPSCNSCFNITQHPKWQCPSACIASQGCHIGGKSTNFVECYAPATVTTSVSTSSTSTSTSTSTTTSIPYIICNPNTPTNGLCVVTNTTNFLTSKPFLLAPNGSIVQSFGGSSTYPDTSLVQQYNDQNATWLITCPDAPNTLNTNEYISPYYPPYNSPYIEGDLCLTPTTPLNTILAFVTTITWNGVSPASANFLLNTSDITNLNITNLGFSGQANTTNNGIIESNISNGYNTYSNIFSGVPPSMQQGIWTWHAQIANLSVANVPYYQNTTLPTDTGASFKDLQFKSGSCTYNYNFTVNVTLQSVQNRKISLPEAPNTISDSLIVNGVAYNGITADTNSITNYGANAIQFADCYLPDIYSGWKFVGANGNYGFYGGLCVYQYNNTPQYWTDGYNSISDSYYPEYVNTIVTPKFDNVTALPFFLYNFTIPSAYSDVSSTPSYYNQSLALYTYDNLNNPSRFIDPVPLNGGSGIFINQSGNLTELYSQFFYGSNSNTPLIAPANPLYYRGLRKLANEFIVDYNAITANQVYGLLASAPLGQNYSISNIINPEFLSTSVNNKLFVLNGNPPVNLKAYQGPNGYFLFTFNYLYELTYIPTGYMNVSLQPPKSVEPYYQVPVGTANLAQYNQTWDSYMANAISEQSGSFYITKAYNITALRAGFYGGPYQSILDGTLGYQNPYIYNALAPGPKPSGQNPSGLSASQVVPFGMTSDTAGDVFIMGANVIPAYNTTDTCESQPGSLASPPSPPCGGSGFNILLIENNGNVLGANVLDPAFGPASSLGYDIYQALILNEPSAISMAVSPGGQYLYLSYSGLPNVFIYEVSTANNALSVSYQGDINLSYSNINYNMNITKYLADGGPFNSSILKNAYNSSKVSNIQTVNDISSYHTPFFITDSQGILYVLDNWVFPTPTTNALSGGSGASGDILMLRAFGSNGIEIPIHPSNYDDMLSTGTVSLSTGLVPNQTYPPYGWPLSVNITVQQPGNGNLNYVSYCAYGCGNSPTSYNGVQYPDGNVPAYDGYPPIGPFYGDQLSDQGGSTVSFFPVHTQISSDFNGSIYLDGFGLADPPSNPSQCSIEYVGEYGCQFYTELLALHPVLQNYTRISLGAGAQYTCYLGVNQYDSELNLPTKNSTTPCGVENSISNTIPPGIGMPNSFAYSESLGSPQQYLSELSLLSAALPTTGSVSGGGTTSTVNPFPFTTSGVSLPTPKTLPSTYINSIISGYLLVPYEYTYQIKQSYAPNPDPSATSGCPDYNFNNGVSTYTAYRNVPSYNDKNSTVNQTIQGGGTYLKYINNGQYYVANLSDANLIMPPQLYYNLFTNRLFGEIFINQSVDNVAMLKKQLVINATTNLYYAQVVYGQYSNTNPFLNPNGGQFPGFSVEQTKPVEPSVYGVASSSPYYSYNPFSQGSNIIFSNQTSPNLVELFSIFSRDTYLDGLDLNLGFSNTILGYNRLNYTYVDEFNNRINMPVDVDFANSTAIALHETASVNVINPNQTLVKINGTAGYYPSIFSITPIPLPPGSSIYLYYDTNINFYNTTNTPLNNPASYYKYAEQCAFSGISGCTFANPLFTQTPPLGQGGLGPLESNIVTFHTQYNSIGECPQEPNSLLLIPNTVECNIYGDYGLPATGTSVTGNTLFCIPDYTNGTGVLSSELGLIGILQPNSIGYFNYTFNVCGTGSGRVVAAFYGWPPPQPTYFTQTPLEVSAATQLAAAGKPVLITSPEFNYTTAPNSTTLSFLTGTYYLSFGSIGIIAAIVIATLIILYMIVAGIPGHKKGMSNK
jgi:hypothetical protein